MGRPVEWTPEAKEEAFERICSLIAESEVGLDHICSADDTLPSSRTFYKWVEEDSALFQRYTRARELQQHYCVDNATVLATELVAKTPSRTIDPQAFTAYWRAMTWRAARLAPLSYGDRQETTIKNPPGESFRQDVTITPEAIAEAALIFKRKLEAGG